MPMNDRFHVGLIRISFTHTCGGISATNAMALPTSCGCNIFDMTSSLGGSGRILMIGVATSAGHRQQARKPFLNSSILKECVSATTACFVAVYAGSVMLVTTLTDHTETT